MHVTFNLSEIEETMPQQVSISNPHRFGGACCLYTSVHMPYTVNFYTCPCSSDRDNVCLLLEVDIHVTGCG